MYVCMYVGAHQWWKYRLVAGKIDFNDRPPQQALSCCPTTDLTYANPKGTMGLGFKTFKIIFLTAVQLFALFSETSASIVIHT